MKAAQKNSRAIRFATLLAMAALGCLFLARPTFLTRGEAAEPESIAIATPAAPAPSPAQDQTATKPDTPEPPAAGGGAVGADTDRDFVEKAAACAVQEETVSRVILNKLVYPEVREYAYKVIEDHRAAQGELKALVASKGLVFPQPEAVKVRKWGQGEKSVDQTYVNLMAEDNEVIVELFEKAVRSNDPEVASFARKTLPLVRNHLHAIQDLRRLTD